MGVECEQGEGERRWWVPLARRAASVVAIVKPTWLGLGLGLGLGSGLGLGLGRHREADRHAVAVELEANTVLGGEASQQGGQRARDLVSLGAVVDEEVLGGGEL